MARTSMVILETDHEQFVATLERLRKDSNSRFVFLLDKNGQQIASCGDLAGADPTALASLVAGNVAATEGLGQLIGEEAFTTLFHEGRKDNLHISLIQDRVILLVIFDEHSSLGLVRLRVNQHTAELAQVVLEMTNRDDSEATAEALSCASLAEITDDDIDALFG